MKQSQIRLKFREKGHLRFTLTFILCHFQNGRGNSGPRLSLPISKNAWPISTFRWQGNSFSAMIAFRRIRFLKNFSVRTVAFYSVVSSRSSLILSASRRSHVGLLSKRLQVKPSVVKLLLLLFPAVSFAIKLTSFQTFHNNLNNFSLTKEGFP